ncbi:MAG: FAD-dependent oxidoreductase [Thiogranum sp.]|nr:FAD-dependent oxidoreductase [Thiogranum sp.]
MDEAVNRSSFWNATGTPTDYPALAGAASADVAVIGAGMVGVTLADRLKRAGKTVVLIEAQRVATQATGRSTAKLTALHGLTYSRITDRHGPEAAQAYARANLEALEYVATRVAETGIECALERTTAYTYSANGESVPQLRREVQAAQRAGLAAHYVEEAPLPTPLVGAVRLEQQIQFHPQRYLAGLAAQIEGGGSRVFENTRAIEVEEGNPCRVLTDVGTVTAARVVLTTHLPFMDRGLFFAKAFPRRHVVLAARIPDERVPDGMFLCSDSGGISVRAFRDEQGAILIATHTGERPGHHPAEQRYRELEHKIREQYQPDQILNCWSNEDYMSMDGMPFVGRMPATEQVFLATGFSAWGLSGGTAAANLLADILLNQRNPLSRHWRADRWTLRRSGGEFLSTNLHTLREMVADRFMALKAPSAGELANGEGGLVRHHGHLRAAWRNAAGELRTYSPYCTHLRCVLAWNGIDRVWECPCHGSRFDHEGRAVHGPARRDLRRYD